MSSPRHSHLALGNLTPAAFAGYLVKSTISHKTSTNIRDGCTAEGLRDMRAQVNAGNNYNGPSLDIFSPAQNWHDYIARMVADHIGGDVLEVGAGIGSLTARLLNAPNKCSVQSWLCLEPDPMQCGKLLAKIETAKLPAICRVVTGSIHSLDDQMRFDVIIYIDVLEHIEDDLEEIKRAGLLINPGGKLIILSPAHTWLFSELDRSAGHHRRYSRSSLAALAGSELVLIESKYMDLVGILASIANRHVLRSNEPSANQIKMWDTLMIPVSRIFDPLFGYNFGKSILAVWERRVS